MPQWNQFATEEVPLIQVSRVMHMGHNGDTINAYYARPSTDELTPGIVLKISIARCWASSATMT